MYDGDIQCSPPGKISGRKSGDRDVACRIEGTAVKGSIAVTEVDIERGNAVDLAAHYEILSSVAVEVAGDESGDVQHSSEREGGPDRESAFAIADQEESVVGSGACVTDGEDILGTAGDERRGDEELVSSETGKGLRGLKGSVAFAEQDLDRADVFGCARAVSGDGEVGDSVAVEVGYDYGLRLGRGGWRLRGGPCKGFGGRSQLGGPEHGILIAGVEERDLTGWTSGAAGSGDGGFECVVPGAAALGDRRHNGNSADRETRRDGRTGCVRCGSSEFCLVAVDAWAGDELEDGGAGSGELACSHPMDVGAMGCRGVTEIHQSGRNGNAARFDGRGQGDGSI